MKKKKWIIAVCVAAAIVVVVFVAMNNLRAQAAEANNAVQTKALQKMTLQDTVDVTGTVESRNDAKVYSPVSTLAVKTVDVKVGDKVNAGDVLCILNTDSLEKQIEQSKATLDTAQKTGQQTVDKAQTQYDNDVANLNNGKNTTLATAKAAVDSAQTALSSAKNQYTIYVQAESDAKAALETAQAAYDAAYAADPASAATAAAKTALDTAQAAYDKAHQTQVLYSSSYNGAQKAYNNAVAQLNAANNAVSQQISTEKEAVDSAQAAANTDAQQAALEALELQLSQATVTAPVSGTVTQVNAQEGAISSGLLFTIDDTDNLEIDTTIKEYDVNNVALGMKCAVESDGTGNDIYEGTLKSIEPAAAQDSTSSLTGTSGTTSSTSDVKFNAVVNVTSQQTKLKIGMTARVSIILNQKEDVYAVPYDAVVTNKAGEKVVYSEAKDASGRLTFREVPVTTGMETDFYIEVSGKDLQDGMQIVSNPDSVQELKKSIVSGIGICIGF